MIQSILNTYKIKGNVCIENYKNIKNFCNIIELKFNLPYGIDEKRQYIEEFTYNSIIKQLVEHFLKKNKKGENNGKASAN